MNPLHNDPLVQDIQYRINTRLTDIKETVSNGSCANFEAYKKQTGIIAGLNEALRLLDESIHLYMRQDDDE